LTTPMPAAEPADYYTTLGAATIDTNIRDRMLAGHAVPGLPYESAWLPVISNAGYQKIAVVFCRENWACGCGVRIHSYEGHRHPIPTKDNCQDDPGQ
jgi:hypothetical protein